MNNQLYAVVLTETNVLGTRSLTNSYRPFIVLRSEQDTLNQLMTQYPKAHSVVFGTKEELVQNGYDLCDEDFDEPLIPSGKAPTMSEYIERVSELVAACESLDELEQRIREELPESEAAAFIERTYMDIQENGLCQVTAVNFKTGGTPINVLNLFGRNHNIKIEEAARQLNYIDSLVANSKSVNFH